MTKFKKDKSAKKKEKMPVKNAAKKSKNKAGVPDPAEAAQQETLALMETHKDALGKLLTLGKKQGYLTYEQINNILPEQVTSSDQIEKVILMLADQKIEITSSPADLEDKQDDKEDRRIRETEEENEEAEEVQRSVKMDDPVRMYLRQMGQISLLTRAEEIALAKRIEEAEEKLKRIVFNAKASRQEVLNIANQIANDEMSLESTIDSGNGEEVEANIANIKKKFKILTRRLRASRKDADLVQLLMQFNLSMEIVNQIIENLRVKTQQLRENRDTLRRLRSAGAKKEIRDNIAALA